MRFAHSSLRNRSGHWPERTLAVHPEGLLVLAALGAAEHGGLLIFGGERLLTFAVSLHL